jgi:hypothetical protein
MGGNFKANPLVILRAHHSAYFDVRNGKTGWQDWAAFTILPLVVLAERPIGCVS